MARRLSGTKATPAPRAAAVLAKVLGAPSTTSVHLQGPIPNSGSWAGTAVMPLEAKSHRLHTPEGKKPACVPWPNGYGRYGTRDFAARHDQFLTYFFMSGSCVKPCGNVDLTAVQRVG